MPLKNTRDTFGTVAVSLHWLLFILVAGLVGSGKYSDSLPAGGKDLELLGTHKQIGVAVFLLFAFRLLWKIINRSPDPLVSGVRKILAAIVHFSLYVVVLGQALTGILMSQLSGNDVSFLGMQLPAIYGASGMLGEVPGWLADGGGKTMRQWHFYGGTAIIVLVGVHILGAVLHHIQGEAVLRRMWFGYKPSYANESRDERSAP